MNEERRKTRSTSKNFSKTEYNSKIEYPMTPEEMYKLIRNKADFGIEGYYVPRKYHDHYKYVTYNERWNTITSKSPPKRNWPPKEWNAKNAEGEDIIKKPKRPNFLDDVYKWCDSFNGLPKGGDYRSYKEEIINKVKDKIAADPGIKKEFPNKREMFLKGIQDKKENIEKVKELQEADQHNSHMNDLVTTIKEQIETDHKALSKTVYEKNKEHYTEKNPAWPRCDRVTVVADAEYCGEQVPFYHTFNPEMDPAERESRKKFPINKKAALCFPAIDKTSKYKKPPEWRFSKTAYKETKTDSTKEEVDDRRKEIYNEKMTNLLDRIYTKQQVPEKMQGNLYLEGDYVKAYNVMREKGKIYINFNPFKNKDNEEDKDKPKKIYYDTPAPNHYFMTPSLKDEKRFEYLKKYPDKRGEEDDEKMKKYVNLRTINRKVYKPVVNTVY